MQYANHKIFSITFLFIGRDFVKHIHAKIIVICRRFGTVSLENGVEIRPKLFFYLSFSILTFIFCITDLSK